MNELIKYFNTNYEKEYGKIAYPRTTIQIYRTYQAIKSYGIKDEELVKLLHNVKLPNPKSIEEKELYADCLYNKDDSEIEIDTSNLVSKESPVFTGSISLGREEGTTVGEGSYAVGDVVEASGIVSHAEGDETIASGDCSHAEGSGTRASGNSSHAEGGATIASGNSSHAEGFYTKASSDYQHVQGKFNIEDAANKYAHIVGNGIDDDKRSNAHTLDWNGNGWYAGKLSQEGTPTGTKDLTTKKYVDNSLENKVDKVNGKGLSTVDFTTAYETKLKKLENYNDAKVKEDIQALSAQLGDIANQTITNEERTKLNSLKNYDDTSVKNDIQVQKARIDTLTTLPEGSTTGDAELIDARIGADGKTYTNLGDGIRTQLTDITTKLNNINGETIKVVVKEKQITLAGYKTSDKLVDKVTTTKKYIVLIKDGTTNIKLALDKDPYGNGRSIFTNSHNGYAINETNESLYIFNVYDTTWTGTICVVEITDNTELEQYLITNGYNAINYNWKGQLNEIHQNLNTVYRQKINISKNDSETVILEKFTNAYNIGNCDVVFEPGVYTFSDIFNHTNEEIPIGSNCHYYFNGSTINATKPDGITKTKNMFGSLRTGGNYELYDGILIGNSLTYIVHDEANANKEMYIRKYHNMIMQNNTGNNTDDIRKCIGGGTGCHGVVEIDSCVFLADFGVDVSYHGIDYSLNDTAEFILVVKNSYFNKALRLDGLGKNQTGTVIYSGNNKQMNAARPTGWTVYEFNNMQ